jgi:hypothetical protein
MASVTRDFFFYIAFFYNLAFVINVYANNFLYLDQTIFLQLIKVFINCNLFITV